MRQSSSDSTLRILLGASFVAACGSFSRLPVVVMMNCSNWSSRVIGETGKGETEMKGDESRNRRQTSGSRTWFWKLPSRVDFILFVAHFRVIPSPICELSKVTQLKTMSFHLFYFWIISFFFQDFRNTEFHSTRHDSHLDFDFLCRSGTLLTV